MNRTTFNLITALGWPVLVMQTNAWVQTSIKTSEASADEIITPEIISIVGQRRSQYIGTGMIKVLVNVK